MCIRDSKKPYERITQDEQIDILIVVNQMLTGFDSKWVNTLYLDLSLIHILPVWRSAVRWRASAAAASSR